MPLRIFPVADVPSVRFSDDFGAAREGGRAHQGTDIFAPEGTPVLAPDDGQVRFTNDPIGGRSFYLHAADGTTYYGTHLSAFVGSDRAVQAGDVVGAVGHDGNAANTPDHLHFEVHPPGGTVNPFPLLQQAPRRTPSSASSGSAWGWVFPLAILVGGAVLYERNYGLPRVLKRMLG